jgi:hypothetical protein
MMTFDEIRTRWELKPIRNCPGRFVIRTAVAELSLQDLLGPEAELHTFQIESFPAAIGFLTEPALPNWPQPFQLRTEK